MTSPRIIVVDDSELWLRAAMRALRLFGWRTTLNPREIDVTAYLRANSAEVVILDFSGHPVQEWIAAAHPARAIVFTACDPLPDVPQAFAVVAKPDVEALRAAVTRALNTL